MQSNIYTAKSRSSDYLDHLKKGDIFTERRYFIPAGPGARRKMIVKTGFDGLLGNHWSDQRPRNQLFSRNALRIVHFKNTYAPNTTEDTVIIKYQNATMAMRKSLFNASF